MNIREVKLKDLAGRLNISIDTFKAKYANRNAKIEYHQLPPTLFCK